MQNNNMATARNIYLALGLMAIANEALQLDMLNFPWKMIVNISKYYA
jgi:hypothetical protein